MNIKKVKTYRGVKVKEVIPNLELQEDGVTYDLRRWPNETDWVPVRRTITGAIGDFPRYEYLCKAPLRELKKQLPVLIEQVRKKALRQRQKKSA